jgi:endonuclease YncB( thermonuclease family)
VNRTAIAARFVPAVLMICLLAALATGCGSSDGSSSGETKQARNHRDSVKIRAQVRAKQIAARRKARAAARQAREDARRKAARERAPARRQARNANSASRRIRIKARALARSGGDVDCGSFASQARAQLYLLDDDPFRLDADGDGVACADLPCPCSVAAGGSPQNDAGAADSGSTAEPPRSFSGTVTHVADGDTLDVTTPAGGNETVRMIGIDTPEVYGGTECGGPAASAYMKRIATGATVLVVSDPTQDRRDHYGRLLAYIDKDSQDLGLTMVKRGLASAYPYDGPFQRYPKYEKADRQARNSGTGSWSHCDISPG